MYKIYQELKVVNKKRGIWEDSQILVGREGGGEEEGGGVGGGTDEKI